MKTAELKRIAQRRPFRPFAVRLSNGARYIFNDARNFGTPKDFHAIVFFGQKDIVVIDTENIVEVFE
ncbi:MAG TPA: hypothetical protein VK562_03185 [Candidatus Acidoferrum sp.]|nr:hypothetical protein [Candidatus Acidoferrum sp.]